MQDTFEVFVGNLRGLFSRSLFGPGGRSKCVFFVDGWITPVKFESLSTSSASHFWKRSIKLSDGRPIQTLFDRGDLSACSSVCLCNLCMGGHAVAGRDTPSTPRSTPTPFDTDSDSGISVNSKMNEERPLPDLPTLIQEALVAIDNKNSGGISRLNILLYIIHKYKPKEDITVLNTKLKTALNYLSRIGVINKSTIEGAKESDVSDSEEIRSRSPSPQPTVPSSPEKKEEETKKGVKRKGPTPGTSKKSKTVPTKATSKTAASKAKGKAKIAQKKTPSLATISANKVKNKALKKGQYVSKSGMVYNSKVKYLSPALSQVCGAKKLPRQEVVKRLWQYIKKKKLQDGKQKTVIICDEKLKAVFKKKKIAQNDMLTTLAGHLRDVE